MDIILVYMLAHVMQPGVSTAPETSERIFKSREECVEFVNTVAGDSVVNENYKYKFASNDGFIIYGGCMTQEELDEFREEIKQDTRESIKRRYEYKIK